MKIHKIAQKYAAILVQASNQTYQDLVQIHDLAEGLTVDPYENLSSEEILAAKDVAKSTAIVADKAYRDGISATDLKFMIDKIKSKILDYASNPNLSSLDGTLSAILAKLQNLAISDVDSQIAGAGSTYVDIPEEEITPGEDFYGKKELDPKLLDVVKDLPHSSSYDDESQSFHGLDIINPR